MEIKRELIEKGINLIEIPSKQYKTNLVSIYLKRPLSKEEVTKNSLIPYILRAGSMKYESQSLMVRELQSLYGSSIGVGVSKVGEKQILSFKLAFTNENYLEEKIAESAINILLDMIFEPCLEDGVFKESYLEIEKEILEEAILSKINNKSLYAVDEAIKHMCEEEPFSIPEDGYIEDLANIDAEILFEHYKNIIASSEIDIVLSGDMDASLVKRLLEAREIPRSEKLVDLARESIYHNPNQVKNIEESLNVNQGKLIMAYRTNIDVEGDMTHAQTLYGVILGGGVSSKLFANVREKHSLCYSIGASIEKMKSIMLIHAGIDFKDFKKAKEKISEQVAAMLSGEISELELRNAKNYVINGIRSVSDSIWSMSDYVYSLSIQGSMESPEEIIQKVESVTVDQIVEVAQKVKLDTVYFLTNKEKE